MEGHFNSSGVAPALEHQKQLLRVANARKGQKRMNRASRQQLESELDGLRKESPVTGFVTSQYFMLYAYPPCATPLCELQPIVLADLRLEIHHTGKVLFVRTFGQPVRRTGVQAAVRDEHGDVDRLMIYNTSTLLKADQVLPKDALFAIKEPFYRDMTGCATLFIDHPSDLIPLHLPHPLVPNGLRPPVVDDKAAADFKTDGNAAYKRADYLSAEVAYSQGLAACGDDEAALRHDLLRNRSVVNFYLGRYERALTDAEGALISTPADALTHLRNLVIQSNDHSPTSELNLHEQPPAEPHHGDVDQRMAELNSKAHRRAGDAACELGWFTQAESHYKKALSLIPNDKDATSGLRRTADRLAELSTGSYDFAKMKKSATRKHNRLDHASFTAHVVVRDAGHRGRGLFTTKTIKAGELVLCEKAFCVALEVEQERHQYVMLNLNTSRTSIYSQATLLFNTIQKMLHGPIQGSALLALQDPKCTPGCSAQEVDGFVIVDAFQTQAIIELDSYGCPTKTSRSKKRQDAVDQQEETSAGVWITASYINHACGGNITRSFVGDMMIVRATKDIPAGQEIMMAYIYLQDERDDTRGIIQRLWGFTCDCVICVADAKSSELQCKLRKALINEAEQFISAHNPTSHPLPTAAVVRKGEALLARLRDTYDEQLFANVPRLDLIPLGIWLLTLPSFLVHPPTAVATATALLRDLGYSVTITGRTVHFDYTHCYLMNAAIQAARRLMVNYRVLGQQDLALQFETFAKGLFITLHGDLQDFPENPLEM